jgi:hypothetical protein
VSAVRSTGGNASCVKAPSPRNNANGITPTNPGPGLCNNDGSMPPGEYDLFKSAPPGTEFDRWECYDVVAGGQPTRDVDFVELNEDDVITCVAVYVLLPKLALLSEFPFAYNGPSANLSAVHAANIDRCDKIPSPRLDTNGITVLQPGPGRCGEGQTGFVDQGTYTLSQTAPAGTTFNTWQCFDITTGNAVALAPATTVSLRDAQSITCVAVYNVAPPPPSPSPSS